MALIPETPETFSFRSRPIPIPGDLRIGWRVALIVLMLGYSRSKQASLAKLHILNDAIRSGRHVHLGIIVNNPSSTLLWNLRVEPAFARAVDFVIGEKLAIWTRSADRTALKLTDRGSSSFKQISGEEDILISEKSILETFAKSVTETVVTAVLSTRRRVA